MKLVILQIIKEKQHKTIGTSAAWTKMIDDRDLSNLKSNHSRTLKKKKIKIHYPELPTLLLVLVSCVRQHWKLIHIYFLLFPHLPFTFHLPKSPPWGQRLSMVTTTGGIQYSSSIEGTLCSLISSPINHLKQHSEIIKYILIVNATVTSKRLGSLTSQ